MAFTTNKTKCACLLIAGAFCLFQTVFAQSSEWMPQYEIDVLKSMNLTYKKPDLFREFQSLECFKDKPKLEVILTCAANQLYSNDGRFMAFIIIHKIFTREDSIKYQKIFRNGFFDVIDKGHIPVIRNNIQQSLGKEAAANWKNYVSYYPSGEAKKKFNADTAITYSIPLKPEDYYKGKYNHLQALVLQKKGRGYIMIYCFYDDLPQKKLDKYMAAIENVFRYGEKPAPPPKNDGKEKEETVIIVKPPGQMPRH